MNGKQTEWTVSAYAYQRESGQFVIKYRTLDGDKALTPIMAEFGDECQFYLNGEIELQCSNKSSDHRQNFLFIGKRK
ncbi:hypothetical protein [Aliivibrio fischeri]|uniref:hypothetical protein n=1 Tax=Aliivibrio fischeri TaxID=668 RepID=UPI00081ECB59|nr:hypothetical protein [Aliivibrio fischeri]OCH40417.1 hypothetical protein A6D99_19040 [Aliivibrio fischeri]